MKSGEPNSQARFDDPHHLGTAGPKCPPHHSSVRICPHQTLCRYWRSLSACPHCILTASLKPSWSAVHRFGPCYRTADDLPSSGRCHLVRFLSSFILEYPVSFGDKTDLPPRDCDLHTRCVRLRVCSNFLNTPPATAKVDGHLLYVVRPLASTT